MKQTTIDGIRRLVRKSITAALMDGKFADPTLEELAEIYASKDDGYAREAVVVALHLCEELARFSLVCAKTKKSQVERRGFEKIKRGSN